MISAGDVICVCQALNSVYLSVQVCVDFWNRTAKGMHCSFLNLWGRSLQVVNRWLSMRLELLGITVVFMTSVLGALFLRSNAGLAGLAITSALMVTGFMNWMVRQSTEMEVNMNGVERILEYTGK